MTPALDPIGALQLTEERFEPSGIAFTVGGELDIATAPILRERLCAALEDGVDRALIDIRAVTFMDSVALAAMVANAKQLDGRMVVVVDPDSYAMLILEVSGLPVALDIVESIEEGHSHLWRGSAA